MSPDKEHEVQAAFDGRFGGETLQRLYLRDARAMGPEWQRDGAVPDKEGFWWGKWRIKAEGTSDPNDPPGNEWEVMHVVENTLDVDDDEHLMVMVPGVEKWQPLENFVWGPKALPAPPKES